MWLILASATAPSCPVQESLAHPAPQMEPQPFSVALPMTPPPCHTCSAVSCPMSVLIPTTRLCPMSSCCSDASVHSPSGRQESALWDTSSVFRPLWRRDHACGVNVIAMAKRWRIRIRMDYQWICIRIRVDYRWICIRIRHPPKHHVAWQEGTADPHVPVHQHAIPAQAG